MSCYKLDNRGMHIASAEPINNGQQIMRLVGAVTEFETWSLKTPSVIQDFIDKLTTYNENSCIFRPQYVTGAGPRYAFWLLEVK